MRRLVVNIREIFCYRLFLSTKFDHMELIVAEHANWLVSQHTVLSQQTSYCFAIV